ncbi:MAG: response regulator transcription factor [Planctomycetaceae bacterium]
MISKNDRSEQQQETLAVNSVFQTQRRVLIIDDHALVRDGVRLRVESDPRYLVCGEAADTAEALELVAALNPDMAIVDISLKTGNGLDLVKRMLSVRPQLLVVVCSMHDDLIYAERALRAGARGYVNKNRSSTDLMEAIRTVFDGRLFACDEVVQRMLIRSGGRKSDSKDDDSPVDRLTDRELEVLERIGRGHAVGQIASELHLSPKTVETYRDRVRTKLNIDSAHELQHFAFRWVSEHNE